MFKNSPEYYENSARAFAIIATFCVIIASYVIDEKAETVFSNSSVIFLIGAFINTYIVHLKGGYDIEKMSNLFYFHEGDDF